MTTAPEEDWTQHSLVQVEGGFIGGLALGMVPFGGFIAGAISGPGTRWAEIGRGVGEVFGGGIAFAAGMAGMLGGGAASTTGVLTIPGVLAVAGSAALVAGGIANVKAGAERLGQALSMSSGSGSSGPPGTAPAAQGSGSFSSGRGPHTAEVTVTRNGQQVVKQTVESGNMTAAEKALGFPRSSLATHTEVRAVTKIPLQAGDEMMIKGQYSPCPSCKGAMNTAASQSGARIIYTWPEGTWIAGK